MKGQFKRFLLTVFILTGSLVGSAQTKESPYAKIGDYILRNYRPDSIALAKYCRRGCIFVKFKVNQQGNMAGISFAGDADSTTFIKDALTLSVQMLKQDARLIDFLKKSGKTIIQPFIYDYQEGCNFPKGGDGNTSKYFLTYMGILSDADHNETSMLDMLKFDGKQQHFFDGVILEPIEVNNVVLH